MQPSISQEERKVIKENFDQNREFAQKVRNANASIGDPILQRDDRYIPKEKTIQPCQMNYFQRMNAIKMRDNRNTQKKTSNKINAESTKQIDHPHKRTYPIGHMKHNQSHYPIKRKTYPEKYVKSIMVDFINRENIYPYKPPLLHIKVDCEGKYPSQELIYHNNIAKFLPCQIYDEKMENISKNNENPRRAMMMQRYKFRDDMDTKERLFGVNNDLIYNEDNHNYRSCSNFQRSTPKSKLVHKVELKEKEDNVDGLITYKYGPNFRKGDYAEKPGNINYNVLVNHNLQNLKENYVVQDS